MNFWTAVWWGYVIAHVGATVGLYHMTAKVHADDPVVRRLCLLCWLVALLVVNVAVMSGLQLVASWQSLARPLVP